MLLKRTIQSLRSAISPALIPIVGLAIVSLGYFLLSATKAENSISAAALERDLNYFIRAEDGSLGLASLQNLKDQRRDYKTASLIEYREIDQKIKSTYTRLEMHREMQIHRIEQLLLPALGKVFTGNSGALKPLLSPHFTGTRWAKLHVDTTSVMDGITTHSIAASPESSAQEFLLDLEAFAQQSGHLQWSDFKIMDYNITKEDPHTRRILSAVLSIDADLRYVDSSRRRSHFVGQLLVDVVPSNDGVLDVNSLRLKKATLTELQRNPAFISKTADIKGISAHPRLEAIRRGGYALALSDINNDGHLDMFLGHWGPSQLFMSRGERGYEDASAQLPADLNLVKAAAFSDFDRDGDKDLFISRFQQNNDLLLLNNDSGQFSNFVSAFPNEGSRHHAMPATLGDFNNDGLTDVYGGFPGTIDFSAANFMQNSELAVQGLFFNNGKLGFNYQSRALPLTTRSLFPHAALGVDYDLDGDTDIVVVDDRMNGNVVYRNDGSGNFARVTDLLGVDNQGYGMGVDVADLDNDGDLDILFTNATFHKMSRLYKNIDKNISQLHADGLKIFLNHNGRYALANNSKLGLSHSGDGAGGVGVFDYNNDGHADIYVVNGLWSGTSREWDIQSHFAQAMIAELAVIPALEARRSHHDYFMKALQNSTRKVAGRTETPSFAGYQRNRLYRNNGNGTFTDVAFLESADSLSDGYVVATSDMDNDGRQDLVLRNCDYGSEHYKFPALEYLSNQHTNTQSLRITLKGQHSNPEAIGAIVRWNSQVRTVTSLNGAVQNDTAVHFGIPQSVKRPTSSPLEVVWPSQLITRINNPQPGHLVLSEPQDQRRTESGKIKKVARSF